jgi:cytochrome c553
MDAAKAQAITECGRCHYPEDAHKYRAGESEDAIGVIAALGGPCPAFVASDAAVIYAKHLAITDNRAPVRRPGGPIGKRAQMCTRCGHRGHPKETCPF